MDSTNIFSSKKTFSILNFILLFLFLSALIINQILIFKTAKLMGIHRSNLMGMVGLSSKTNAGSANLTGQALEDAIKLVISQGPPAIYGSELGVSFDAVEPSMNIMKQMDPTYGQAKIALTGDDLKRYTEVGLMISCEYCCGVPAIIDKQGRAACGCAHSQAMRGLLAYLIKNHGSEYSNDQMLRELARWKGMYFPKQMIQKMAGQLQGADFTPDISSLLLEVKLPNYGQGNQAAPLPSNLNNLPNMVGGC